MRDFPETHYSLIARVQELGDDASWTEFLGIYQPVVFRMARKRGLQNADADDVMQQVFLSISTSIERWSVQEGQPPFRAWLTTIARNAITKSLARRPRDSASGSSSVMQMIHQVPDVALTTTEIQTEARREVFRWVAEQVRPEFSTETWSVFWQTSIEGLCVTDVALASGRTPGAIYVARYRVLARIKERVHEVSQHWDLMEERGSP